MEELSEGRGQVWRRPDHARHRPHARGRRVPGGGQEGEEQEVDQTVQVQAGHQPLVGLLCHWPGGQQRRAWHATVGLDTVLENNNYFINIWVLDCFTWLCTTVLSLYKQTKITVSTPVIGDTAAVCNDYQLYTSDLKLLLTIIQAGQVVSYYWLNILHQAWNSSSNEMMPIYRRPFDQLYYYQLLNIVNTTGGGFMKYTSLNC